VDVRCEEEVRLLRLARAALNEGDSFGTTEGAAGNALVVKLVDTPS
jgi:hypothetical protein